MDSINEWIFILHCTLIVISLFATLYLGREGVIVFTTISWVLANFFVTKQIVLAGFEVTASDVYAVGAMLSMSVLQELYGKEVAIKSVKISFFTLFFTTVMAWLHVRYIPSGNDTTHYHFEILLSPGPRLVIASFLTFLISNRIEIALFQLLKRIQALPFALRSCMTASIVAVIDTCLFTFLGLSGIASSLLDICIVSSAIKIAAVLLISPFLFFVSYFYPSQKRCSSSV